jgi:hypothetical protein
VKPAATLFIVAALLAGCGTDQAASSTTEQVDPGVPTGAALAANEVFIVSMPDGYADCGTTVLTSGWPTTTVFNPETTLTCLNDAIASGTPSQYAYWGRDGTGGIEGVIIRVQAEAPIALIAYSVDATGAVTSQERTCSQLTSGIQEPPTCAG